MSCRSGKPDEPLVLVATERNARRLTSACPQALGLGLAPGMTLADALARVPDVGVDEAAPDADAQLLLHLSDMALRWSPIVQPDPPDGLLIDVSGCTHLFGGEVALAADAKALLGRQMAVRHALSVPETGEMPEWSTWHLVVTSDCIGYDKVAPELTRTNGGFGEWSAKT